MSIAMLIVLLLSCETGNPVGDNNDTVTDADGNKYKTVKIGTQVWMVENLKTTKYNDSSVIPCVADSTEWSNLNSPGYCWYNNDETSFKNIYGALYNWHTVNTKKLCPTGWRIPTKDEWDTLINYLGGVDVAGGKMKEVGLSHWDSPNTEATNISGFTALPGGYRISESTCYGIGQRCYLWSSTESAPKSAHGCGTYFMTAMASIISDSKETGYCVRCIKD